MNAAPKPDTFERDIAEAMALANDMPVVRTYQKPTLVEAGPIGTGGVTTLDDDERIVASCKRTVESRSKMVADRKASTKERAAALRAEIAALNADATRLNARDNRIIAGSRAALKAMGAGE